MASNININRYRTQDTKLVKYIDTLFNLIGIDITYEKFKLMSDEEIKEFIRDSKIKKILE